MEKISIKVVCQGGCGGTGVYQGFAEPKGTAVVCLGCKGTGCQVLSGEPFKERKVRKGVETVRRSRGAFVATGIGGTGPEVSYEEFLKGKMP